MPRAATKSNAYDPKRGFLLVNFDLMDELHAPALEGLFRCGLPKRRLDAWLEQHGKDGLRIASYGLSSYEYFGYYLPQNVHLQLLIGVSGIDPSLVSDLSSAPPSERWQKLLERSASEQRSHVLKVLGRIAGWQRAGAKVRVVPPGRRSGLMHLKLYLGSTAALAGSANFTSQGMTGEDQHQLLLEVSGPSLIELSNWWTSMWTSAGPSTVHWKIRRQPQLGRAYTIRIVPQRRTG